MPANNNQQDIRKRVIQVIARTCQIPAEEIQLHSSLESLGIDSLEGASLLFALEEEFDVILPNEAKHLETVENIVTEIFAFLKVKTEEEVPS